MSLPNASDSFSVKTTVDTRVDIKGPIAAMREYIDKVGDPSKSLSEELSPSYNGQSLEHQMAESSLKGSSNMKWASFGATSSVFKSTEANRNESKNINVAGRILAGFAFLAGLASLGVIPLILIGIGKCVSPKITQEEIAKKAENRTARFALNGALSHMTRAKNDIYSLSYFGKSLKKEVDIGQAKELLAALKDLRARAIQDTPKLAQHDLIHYLDNDINELDDLIYVAEEKAKSK